MYIREVLVVNKVVAFGDINVAVSLITTKM